MATGGSATSTKSMQEARKKLQQFLRSLDTIPDEELDREVPRIYSEAVAQTPYKSGKLERSVYVRKSSNKRDRVGIVAGASAKGSQGYNYAGIQHENTNFQHPIKGKAYYIRDPFNAGVRRIKSRMKYRINQAKP